MTKVKSAERTLRFLELLSKKRNGLSFTDIQSGLDIPKSSAYSLIQELMECNYLLYNVSTKKYYAGIEYIKLCTQCFQSTDLLEELSILTSNLGHELNLTSHAGILEQRSVMYLSKYENNSDISLMKNIGMGLKLPAHCTAMGKVLLSQFSDDELYHMYADIPLKKLTEKSIDVLDELIEAIREVRKQDYAIEISEASLYTACIALPLYKNQLMIAAFSVTLPVSMFETADREAIIDTMKRHKDVTEQRLFSF